MLRDNKVSKYLLYAIGEIVLVLIGILLALQINAWKQNKNDKKTIGLHIKALLDETNDNIEELKNTIQQIDYFIQQTNVLLNLYKKKDFSNPKLETNTYILYTNDIVTPSSASFENLKNSQIYALIDNFAVKKSLANAYKKFDDIKMAEEIDKIPKTAFYTDYVLPKGFLIGIMPKSENFYNNPYFGNIIMTVLSTNEFIRDESQEALLTTQELQKTLKEYYRSLDIGPLQERKTLLEYLKKDTSNDEIIRIYKTQDPNDPKMIVAEDSEQVLNRYGYYLLEQSKTNEALKIFELNKELYPTSPNAHDSYGEGLLILGDTINAIKAYKKALELDPAFPTALAMLKKIEK